jgi:hypothetical protein
LVSLFSLFVSLVYCAENIVRWFVVREKHCWMAADSADKSKRTGRLFERGTGNTRCASGGEGPRQEQRTSDMALEPSDSLRDFSERARTGKEAYGRGEKRTRGRGQEGELVLDGRARPGTTGRADGKGKVRRATLSFFYLLYFLFLFLLLIIRAIYTHMLRVFSKSDISRV